MLTKAQHTTCIHKNIANHLAAWMRRDERASVAAQEWFVLAHTHPFRFTSSLLLWLLLANRKNHPFIPPFLLHIPGVDFRFILRSHKTSESHISHLAIIHSTVDGCASSLAGWDSSLHSNISWEFLKTTRAVARWSTHRVWVGKLHENYLESFLCSTFTTPKHLMLHIILWD